MSAQEVAGWRHFNARFPLDDYHRHYRPAALVAHAMGGANVDELIDWLDRKPPPEGMSEADMTTLKAFGIKPQER